MIKTLLYLRYILRHKWFVGVAGRNIGLSWWRCITHDLSKLLPDEFFPYAEYFYGGPHKPWEQFTAIDKQYLFWDWSLEGVQFAFDKAWLKHQHRNRHHWQYWLLKEDSGKLDPLPMPKKYILEMVADWMGAGRAITGQWEVCEWYEKNVGKMQLHLDTRELVELLLTPYSGELKASRSGEC